MNNLKNIPTKSVSMWYSNNRLLYVLKFSFAMRPIGGTNKGNWTIVFIHFCCLCTSSRTQLNSSWVLIFRKEPIDQLERRRLAYNQNDWMFSDISDTTSKEYLSVFVLKRSMNQKKRSDKKKTLSMVLYKRLVGKRSKNDFREKRKTRRRQASGFRLNW